MDDIQLAQNTRSVRRKDHLLQVVDDDFVAAVGTQRGLDGLGNGLAGFDVADDGSIFGIVAVYFPSLADYSPFKNRFSPFSLSFRRVLLSFGGEWCGFAYL